MADQVTSVEAIIDYYGPYGFNVLRDGATPLTSRFSPARQIEKDYLGTTFQVLFLEMKGRGASSRLRV